MLRSILKSVGLLLIGREGRAAIRREFQYSQKIRETRHWMSGSFPEVHDAMLHVQVCINGNPGVEHNDNPRYMSGSDCFTSIDQFRERMRDKYSRDSSGNTRAPLPELTFDTEQGFDVAHKESV